MLFRFFHQLSHYRCSVFVSVFEFYDSEWVVVLFYWPVFCPQAKKRKNRTNFVRFRFLLKFYFCDKSEEIQEANAVNDLRKEINIKMYFFISVYMHKCNSKQNQKNQKNQENQSYVLLCSLPKRLGYLQMATQMVVQFIILLKFLSN